MQVSVTDAKARLTELVRRAESSDEGVLTRHGQAAVGLVPVKPVQSYEERMRVPEEVMVSAARNTTLGPSGAELQGALHDENGVPV